MIISVETLYETIYDILKKKIPSHLDCTLHDISREITDIVVDYKGEGDTVTHIHRDMDTRKSSLEIGTSGKGGGIKVYVDPSDPEDSLDRIDMMCVFKNYVANIIAASQEGSGKNPYKPDSTMDIKFKRATEMHDERVQSGEWKNRREPL